jgi:hypothetical protein
MLGAAIAADAVGEFMGPRCRGMRRCIRRADPLAQFPSTRDKEAEHAFWCLPNLNICATFDRNSPWM